MKSYPLDELSFEDKIRYLIKHQTFEAELKSNAERVEYVQKAADTLISNRHEKSGEIGDIVKVSDTSNPSQNFLIMII